MAADTFSFMPEVLPSYLVASPPPRYSSFPACGEAVVESTPRTQHDLPSGTITQTKGSVTIVFMDQEDGATTPMFRRLGNVNGALLLEKHDKISEVTVKLTGRLEYLHSHGGGHSVSTVDRTSTVWSSKCQRGGDCPSSLPFSLNFPSSYHENGKDYPLPVSAVISMHGTPSIVITSVYNLLVYVSYTGRSFGLLPKRKIIRIPLKYVPRSRPNRPIIPTPLFCALKSSPEEWTQTMSETKLKPCRVGVGPVRMSVLTPSVQVFVLSDAIPFHIQLSGCPLSLLQLLSSSAHSVSTPLSVTLIRKFEVEVYKSCAQRFISIGEGKLWPVPPTSSQLEAPPSEEDVLDWKGEVRANPDITYGGYTASGVTVADVIQVSLRPPHNSPFLPAYCFIPIKLVTDPWIDNYAGY